MSGVVKGKEVAKVEPHDLSSVLEGIPAGKVVALSNDMTRVAAFGDSIIEVFHAAQAAGEPNPVLLVIPTDAIVA